MHKPTLIALLLIALLFIALFISACSGDSDTPSNVPFTNTAPVADAGPDQTVTFGESVSLDGTGSSDANGDILTFAWTMTDRPTGSTAQLSDPTVEQPGFTPDVDGDYVVQLIVNDGELDSAPASITVTVSIPSYGWSAIERIVSTDDVTDAIDFVSHPVPARFDADTIHLYFSGVAYKTYAVVPAYIYRIVSDDNGDTWSSPERMSQLEGNYQHYVVGYYDGKLLLVWHDGSHAELYHTALESAAAVPAAPTLYLAYGANSREVTGLSMWNQTMLGMWHPSSVASNSPFTGEAGSDTANLSGVASPWTGTYYHGTLVAPDRAIVLLTDTSLMMATFDGTSLAMSAPLGYPEADAALEYAGNTFYQAQFEQTRGDIYFTGRGEGLNKYGIYRVRLTD